MGKVAPSRNRVLNLLLAFRQCEQQWHEAFKKVEEIEAKNEAELFRDPRVIVGRNYNGGDRKHGPIWATSHEEIDQTRGRFLEAMRHTGAAAERYAARTRELHAQLDGDTATQEAMRKHIGWTAAQEAMATCSQLEKAAAAKIAALRPQTPAELRDKASVALALWGEGVPGFDDEAIIRLIVGDITRLFGAAPPELKVKP